MICPHKQHRQQHRRQGGSRYCALASAEMVIWKALDALSHQLELCEIDADTRVVALLDSATDPDRTALIRAAIDRTGAEAIELRVLGAGHSDADSLLADALDAADVVVTTAPIPITLRRGLQVLRLLAVDPQAFPPHANLRRRVWAFNRHLDDASDLLLSDAHGTNLTLRLARSKVLFDHGLLGEDQANAVFPSGWTEIVPARDTVDGTIVLMPGDTILNGSRSISSPVRLQIVADMITAIDGDSADGDVVRALLEYPGEPSAYATAAITVGMNPHAQPPAPFDARLLDPDLARLLAGSITVSFGNNLVADRPCAQSITMALPARSLTLDRLPVVTIGALQGDFAPDVYELGL